MAAPAAARFDRVARAAAPQLCAAALAGQDGPPKPKSGG